MSRTVDANILLYAVNEDAAEHRIALELIEVLGTGPDLLYLFWPTIMGFLRISTHGSILPDPLSPKAAMTTVRELLIRPHVRSPGENQGFWELYQATGGASARGNLVPDVHLATLMRQHGVRTIYTRDRGFRRFDAIEVLDPLA